MAQKPNKSIARSLGEFFGHIIKGATTDPGKQRTVVRHDVEEETRDTAEGRVTLRRTTIEEVEVDRSKPKPKQ